MVMIVTTVVIAAKTRVASSSRKHKDTHNTCISGPHFSIKEVVRESSSVPNMAQDLASKKMTTEQLTPFEKTKRNMGMDLQCKKTERPTR